MKTNRLFWLLSGAPLLLVPSSGCMFLKAPEAIATPTPVPTPRPPFFDVAAGQPNPALTHLNAPGDPVKPDAFRIASAITGDTVALQSINTVQSGNPPKDVVTVDVPDTVKLAGIVAPTTDPGLQGARNAISGWTVGQNLDVDEDPKFPTDLSDLPLRQIYFKGRKGPYEGQTLSLNRMLVRSGWAVVDLYSPTSFDTSQWLLDEAYARNHRLGFWKFGQAVQQRIPVKMVTPTGIRTGSKSKVTIIRTDGARLPTVAAGATGATTGVTGANSQTTTQTTQTTTTSTRTTTGTTGATGLPAPATGAPATGAPATGSAARGAATGAAGAPRIGGTPAGVAVTAPGTLPAGAGSAPATAR